MIPADSTRIIKRDVVGDSEDGSQSSLGACLLSLHRRNANGFRDAHRRNAAGMKTGDSLDITLARDRSHQQYGFRVDTDTALVSINGVPLTFVSQPLSRSLYIFPIS